MLERIKKQENDINYEKFIEKSYENSYDFDKYLKVKNPKIQYSYISMEFPRQCGIVTSTIYKEDFITDDFMNLYKNHHEEAILKMCGGAYIDYGLINAARHIEIYFDKKSIIFEKLSIKKALFLAHWVAYVNKTRATISSYSNKVSTINIIYDKVGKSFEYKYNRELEVKY